MERAIQWPCNGGPEQRWYRTYGAHDIKLQNANSQLYRSVAADSYSNGAAIIQWQYSSGPHGEQDWRPISL
ncbi:hypothetical protein GCM10022224_075630 [Nonomuraea antimicrobica]|uniref:Ricin B lectin domain-containing protein n=1 Tax=Nonomuraea antimicrobica TaxID=561173 RepID=A0ABP7CZB7_9ACTN